MPIEVSVTDQNVQVSTSGQTVNASVSGGVGPAGPTGANGATGATGPQGPTGPAGTTTWAGITDKPSTFPADLSGPQTFTGDDASTGSINGSYAYFTTLVFADVTSQTSAFTTALRTKLNGIATGATANATDAQLRDRSTHTGTQAVTTLETTGTASASTYLRGDGAWTAISTYTLPAATTSTLGGVIVGTGLGVSSGTASVTYGTTAGTACQGNDSRLSDSRTPTGSAGGDLTGTYPNPMLSASGATAGTYKSVTVDAKGRVTGGTNPTTLSGYGITDAAPLASPAFTGTATLASGKLAIGSSTTTDSFDVTGTSSFRANGTVLKIIGGATASMTTSFTTDTFGGLSIGANGSLVAVSGNGGNATLRGYNSVVLLDHGYDNGATSHIRFSPGATEAARCITSSANGSLGGAMLIGYTATQSTSTLYRLQVNSQIFATSSTIATSDGRYKENISDISGALGIVNQLRPVEFSWKPHPVHKFPTGKTVGFIAQEVQSALSETSYVGNVVKANHSAVAVENEDGTVTQTTGEEFLGIAEGNLIAILTAAVKELASKVAVLEAATL